MYPGPICWGQANPCSAQPAVQPALAAADACGHPEYVWGPVLLSAAADQILGAYSSSSGVATASPGTPLKHG